MGGGSGGLSGCGAIADVPSMDALGACNGAVLELSRRRKEQW